MAIIDHGSKIIRLATMGARVGQGTFGSIAPQNPAGAGDMHLIQSMDEEVIAIHLKNTTCEHASLRAVADDCEKYVRHETIFALLKQLSRLVCLRTTCCSSPPKSQTGVPLDSTLRHLVLPVCIYISSSGFR